MLAYYLAQLHFTSFAVSLAPLPTTFSDSDMPIVYLEKC